MSLFTLKYGAYSFEPGSVQARMTVQAVRNQGGQVISTVQGIQVTGYINGTSAADLTQKSNALYTAIIAPGLDLAMYDTNGALTSLKLISHLSITGTRLSQPLQFSGSAGNEYVNTRYFSFGMDAEYPFASAATFLMSFHETLNFEGGGPLIVLRPNLDVLPQKQVVQKYTVYRASQQGQAVGYRQYPPVSAPIFPGALIKAPAISMGSPDKKGLGYQGYSISWRYEYESATPLVGVPNIWR